MFHGSVLDSSYTDDLDKNLDPYLFYLSTKDAQQARVNEFDFTLSSQTQLNPALSKVALTQFQSTYNQPNITADDDNNTMIFTFANTDGGSDQTLTLSDGLYSMEDINNSISAFLQNLGYDGNEIALTAASENGLYTLYTSATSETGDITIKWEYSSFTMKDILGFSSQTTDVTVSSGSTNYTTAGEVNTLRKIDAYRIFINVATSYLDGELSQCFAVIPIGNIEPNTSFTFQVDNPIFLPITIDFLTNVKLVVTDQDGNAISLDESSFELKILAAS